MRRVEPFVAAMLLTIAPATAGADGWGTAGDIGRGALVAVALGAPAIEKDWRGTWQAGASLGSTWLATEALKQALPHERPDRSDRRSFPSRHASLSFAAAATLQQRRGWAVGAPAHVLAAFVGFTRVKARKHHWYDVVAGAAIGEAAGLLLTSRRRDDLRVVAWGDTRNAGVSVGLRF